MTTDELLWNATFENTSDPTDNGYNYFEELAMDRYYQNKELLEQFGEYFRPAC